MKKLKELSLIYETFISESKHLLEEMFVIGDDYSGDYFVIAHRDKIFKLDLNIPKTNEDVLLDISNEFNVDIGTVIRVSGIESLIFWIHTKNPTNLNILFGYYVKDENKLIILDKYFHMFKNLEESVLVKKVYKQLNVSKVVLQSDMSIGFTRDDIDGKNSSNLFYHGTTSNYINSILHSGIDNKTENTNFSDKIKKTNKNKLFITSNFQYALNHAVEVSRTRGGYPVVVEFKIRMPDLLQADYDIKIQTKSDDISALKSSREAGVYGYTDRILPTDFKDVYITNHIKNYEDYKMGDLKSVGWQTLKNYLNIKEMTFDEVLDMMFGA